MYTPIVQEAVAIHLPEWFDWRIYWALLYRESKFNPKAKSPVGARGIAQFMPNTWDEYTRKLGMPNADIEDPVASIMVGAYYLDYLIDEWSRPRPQIDRICLAMASYNAGLGNILSAQRAAGDPALYHEIVAALPEITGIHSRETINYVQRILATYGNHVCTGKA